MRLLLTSNTSFALANFRAGLIRELRQAGHDLVALVPLDEYTAALRELGCEIVELRLDRRGTAPHREARTLASVHAKLRRIRPDAVLSYTIKNNLYAGMSAQSLRIPVFPNITGQGTLFAQDSVLGALARQMYRVAFRTAPVVFFQNGDDMERFVAPGIVPAERARLLPGSGVDLTRFTVSPPPGSRAAPVFLLIARLLWEKGLGEFVEAARAVRARFPEASFQLLGKPEEPGRGAIPQEVIDSWQREGVVTYLGTVRDVRPVIAGADCVVLPSYYREGTPRVLLEAAASGRPIITTDTAGCRDVVKKDENGFLVTPRDGDDLARAMISFAAMDPADRARMGLAGRAHLEARYDERLVIAAYMEALGRVATIRGSR